MGLKQAWARWTGRLEPKAPRLHKFLTSQEKPIPVLREITGFALVIALGATILWGSMGQPLGDSPVVVVESGSMMHCANGVGPEGSACETERYGRIGTIDPGDLIFVKDIDGKGDIKTCAADDCQGNKNGPYGKGGDVIIYQPDGKSSRTPIIHRAMFWLEIHDDNGSLTFTIPELVKVRGPQFARMTNLDHPEIQSLGLKVGYANDLRGLGAGPKDSGFITRGDNNRDADQDPHQTIASLPVKPSWILGKARGEVPWLGLVKLKVSDWAVGTNNYGAAPSDAKTMLLISLAVLLGGPYVVERVVRYRRGAREKREAQAEAEATPQDAPPPSRTDNE
jgi:signal peptidase